ncbi:M23 family metallopeptidase [Stenotrophomonas maltophilia]|jgi:murein DD-endopeptidase MepM/ murein hydrolase activator NlpD|uniref:M23 family metallopeptidase n=1 Tax=Stenotrophomonas TaxID=40323 RepID=UPI0006BA3327|nr:MULTISPECIES: M23 family metallopeptidase [unclassified Stenotrophomonas]KPG74569.1 endopeptidase [Stenotrophomonas maltophilia]MBA0243648.1 M23 family metallopeptidase [Stenotrophomonas maltophilia]MBA0248105.1 M23 family metallopeptidase [Stenotrophomonas maltophilia]MBA0307783.1 M23 family metallopeptidase [Stenotrophomonas maltophilia]MBA0439997.1 M23 family metallopeptidase [Stenotrophomonas maltophilia]
MRLSQLIVIGVVLGLGLGWWLRRDAAETTAVSTPATPLTVMATPTAEAATPRASLPASVDAAPDGLLLPVQGVLPSQLRDTFTDARSEGRVHDAIDIMADAGTPVLAVADGTVEKLFDSKRGGLTIYQFEPSGRWCYYYAHLQRYADGLSEKQVIKRGDVIGYVGSTGNASAQAPHLHFEVHVLGPEKQWWKGESINPYPLLKSAASTPGAASAAR